MKMFKKAIGIIFIILISLGLIYGLYWVGKTLSYNFFYKDMVKSTITQMVKQEALK